MRRPEARRERPVLALDVDTNDRIRPVQEVRDDDARALPRSWRGGQGYTLLPRQHETPPTDSTQDDSLATEQTGRGQFAARRIASIAMQRTASGYCNRQRAGYNHGPTGCATQQQAASHRLSVAEVVAVAENRKRGGLPRVEAERPEEHIAGEIGADQQQHRSDAGDSKRRSAPRLANGRLPGRCAFERGHTRSL